MIDEADRDGDGEVNEQEFLRIMKKTSLYWNWILFLFAHVRMCLVGASFFFSSLLFLLRDQKSWVNTFF